LNSNAPTGLPFLAQNFAKFGVCLYDLLKKAGSGHLAPVIPKIVNLHLAPLFRGALKFPRVFAPFPAHLPRLNKKRHKKNNMRVVDSRRDIQTAHVVLMTCINQNI
jgi:hypothetical protein